MRKAQTASKNTERKSQRQNITEIYKKTNRCEGRCGTHTKTKVVLGASEDHHSDGWTLGQLLKNSGRGQQKQASIEEKEQDEQESFKTVHNLLTKLQNKTSTVKQPDIVYKIMSTRTSSML